MIKSSTARSSKKRKVQSGFKAIINIKATFNNTHITCTNEKGEVICWSKPGEKFKGAKKGTPYAAMQAAKKVATMAISEGVKTVVVIIKGPGSGREFAIKGLQEGGLSISLIIDKTPRPHNGCRPPKERRN